MVSADNLCRNSSGSQWRDRRVQYLRAGTASYASVLLFVVIALVMIAAVVALNEGQRRLPVQYAKRVVGRKVYGGQSTFLPLKVNTAELFRLFCYVHHDVSGTIASWFQNSAVSN